MSAIAVAKKSRPLASQSTASVVQAGATLTVRDEHGQFTARQAVSCLVEPEVGDRVMLFSTEQGESYVVAVLEREEPGPVRIDAAQGIRIASREGEVAIVARDGIAMATAGELALTAGELQVRAGDTHLFLERVAMAGRSIVAQVEKSRVVAGVIDWVAERLTQRSQRSYRIIEELDSVRCKQLDYRVEKTANIRAQDTLLTAANLVKVDGEQIHFG